MNSYKKSSNTKYGLTCINAKEYVYIWLIQNFKFHHFNINKALVSPKFSTGENEEHTWEIQIKDNLEYFTLSMSLYHGGPEANTTLILSICDKQGVEKYFKESQFLVKYKNKEPRSFPEYIRKDYLLDEKNGLIINNTLTIKCKFYFEGEIVSSSEVEQNNVLIDSAVTYNLECLLDDTKLSDVKIVVGNKEFQAHKCILAARSRIFLAMFEHDMLEKNENVVTIEDIDSKVIEAVLRFMYCGKIESKISMYDLFAAANKYELEELKNICEDKLLDSVNVENVGEALIFADCYKAEKLKKHVLQFITNRATDMDFEKFKINVEPHSPLLVDLVRQLIYK